jgi:hypothetical protein
MYRYIITIDMAGYPARIKAGCRISGEAGYRISGDAGHQISGEAGHRISGEAWNWIQVSGSKIILS